MDSGVSVSGVAAAIDIYRAALRDRLECAVLRAMDSACKAPMVWGVDDCALWCANILREALGYDPAEDYRGRYISRNGAIRVMGDGGMIATLDRAANRFGWALVHPERAQAGDIGVALVPVHQKRSRTNRLGGVNHPKVVMVTNATVICRSPGWFVGRKDECGFVAAPASKIIKAWSVV